MIISSVDRQVILDTMAPYITKVAKVYFEIRTGWNARGWYVFDDPADVERVIYELLDSCFELRSYLNEKEGDIPEWKGVSTTGITITLRRCVFTEERREAYDLKYPMNSRANGGGLNDYSTVGITFTIADEKE